jgi:hypothetical protein
MNCIEVTSVGLLPEWAAKNHGMLLEYFMFPCILKHGNSLVSQKFYRPKTLFFCGLVLSNSLEDYYGADKLFKCEQ